MGIILKLECGRDTLDINSGRYCVEDSDFAPPTTARAVTYGSLVAGADAIAKRRENREWSFTINITAAGNASISEAERALRNLQSFLNRAGVHDPLYVAYRSFDDYSYEPYFGQFGAFTRYEVVHASAQAQGNYSRPLIGSNVIYGVRVTLVIKPQALGKWQASGQAIGGVFEDYIGKADGLSRGTRVPSSTTNLMDNPIFGNATWNDGWTATNLVASQNTDKANVLYGDSSARLLAPGAGRFTESINVGGTSTHVVSFYIRRADGADPGANVLVYYGSAQAATRYAVGGGWYRYWLAVTGVAAGTETGVHINAQGGSSVYYVDGFQIEQASEPSSLVHGDLLDCSWAGTKHRSTSTRTAARLRYNFNDALRVLDYFSVRFVWTPEYTDYSRTAYLFDDTDGHLRAWIDSSNRYNFQTSAASSIQSSAVTLTAMTPEVMHFVFSGGTAYIYRNGAQLVTGSTTGDTVAPTYLYVASENDATNQLGGTVIGFATFDRAMTAAEVDADYDQIVKQATDHDRIDPLPWVFTEDGDSVVDNDNDGTLFCYAVVGGLMGDDVETALKLDSSNTFILGPGVTIGSLPVPQYLFDKDILTDGGTNTLLFENGTGTVDADANGNAVKRISLSTATTTLLETAISLRASDILHAADNVTGYFVAKDAGTLTNVQVRMSVDFGGANESFVSDWRTLATSAAFRPFLTFEMPLTLEDYILDSSRVMGFKIQVRRTAGASTQNFDVSHAIWLLNYAGVYTADVTNSPDLDMAYLRGRVLELVDDSAATRTRGRRILNRPLLIRPEHLNVLMMQHTFDNYAASKTTWTSGYSLEIEQLGTRPRWDIY